MKNNPDRLDKMNVHFEPGFRGTAVITASDASDSDGACTDKRRDDGSCTDKRKEDDSCNNKR